MLSANPDVLMMEEMRRLEAEMASQRSMQAFLAPVPVPSTVNRRFNFSEPNMDEQLLGNSSIAYAMRSLGIDNNMEEYNARKDKGSDWSSWRPSCLISTSLAGKTIGRRVVAILTIVLLVLLAVFLMRSSRKR